MQFSALLPREVRARGKHFFNLADAKRGVQALMAAARLVLEEADLAGLMTTVVRVLNDFVIGPLATVFHLVRIDSCSLFQILVIELLRQEGHEVGLLVPL